VAVLCPEHFPAAHLPPDLGTPPRLAGSSLSQALSRSATLSSGTISLTRLNRDLGSAGWLLGEVNGKGQLAGGAPNSRGLVRRTGGTP
jgi:hypothetical protein